MYVNKSLHFHLGRGRYRRLNFSTQPTKNQSNISTSGSVRAPSLTKNSPSLLFLFIKSIEKYGITVNRVKQPKHTSGPFRI